MKKLIALLLALLLALTMCGCLGREAEVDPHLWDGKHKMVFLQSSYSGENPPMDLVANLLLNQRSVNTLYTSTLYVGSNEYDAGAWKATLEDCAASGEYDVLAGFGVMSDVIAQVAAEYPELMFVVFDGVVEADNVCSITLRRQEPAYLMGLLAAEMTLSGTERTNDASLVGFLGDAADANSQDWLDGYLAGIKAEDNGTEVMTAYVNDGTDSTAYELSAQLLADGCDVVFDTVTFDGSGAARAAYDAGTGWAICVGANQESRNSALKSAILTSVYFQLGTIAKAYTDDLAAGNNHAGETLSWSFYETAAEYVSDGNYAALPEEIRTPVDSACNEMIEGTFGKN